MILVLYRNYFSTAILTGYSKKLGPVYYDNTTGKPISRRKWSNEMKSYVLECEKYVRPAPFRMKPTILGYIFILGFIGLFAYLVYDSVKPNSYEAQNVSRLTETMSGGDVYFGHYLQKKPGANVASEAGFGWFKIMDAGAGSLLISKAKEISKQAKPSNELNSNDFETESTPMKIKGQESYQIDLVSEDGNLEVSLTEKK